MSYSAILFDMDGVIIDSEPAHMVASQKVLEKYGYTLSESQYGEHFFARTAREGFERYFRSIGAHADSRVILDEKTALYLDVAKNSLIVCPGAVDFISDLARTDIALALVTGSLLAEANLTVQTLGLDNAFSAIIAAEHFTRSKPHPESYFMGAAAVKAEPSDCLVIEDSPRNIASLAKVGIRSIGITSSHNTRELEKAGAVLVLDSLYSGCLDALLS